jgi:hypothetical protein
MPRLYPKGSNTTSDLRRRGAIGIAGSGYQTPNSSYQGCRHTHNHAYPRTTFKRQQNGYSFNSTSYSIHAPRTRTLMNHLDPLRPLQPLDTPYNLMLLLALVSTSQKPIRPHHRPIELPLVHHPIEIQHVQPRKLQQRAAQQQR